MESNDTMAVKPAMAISEGGPGLIQRAQTRAQLMERLESRRKQLKEHVGLANGHQLLDGHALLEIKEEELFFAKGYSSFNKYLAAELPGMDRSWCFRRMTVAKTFTQEDAQAYGIDSLRHLCTLSKEVFTEKKPRELMVGEHTKVDAKGVTRTLNFETEHTRRALLSLIQAFRKARRPPPLPMSPAAGAIDAALKGAAAAGSVEVRVAEDSGKLTVTVVGAAPELVELLGRLGAATNPLKRGGIVPSRQELAQDGSDFKASSPVATRSGLEPEAWSLKPPAAVGPCARRTPSSSPG
jgi:hypothetical protein